MNFKQAVTLIVLLAAVAIAQALPNADPQYRLYGGYGY
uniref:Uncharacterized protein n=1 Tax=Anopheles atroparvus TaxID=41427 RepID=A0AAG5DD80_ANOAO